MSDTSAPAFSAEAALDDADLIAQIGMLNRLEDAILPALARHLTAQGKAGIRAVLEYPDDSAALARAVTDAGLPLRRWIAQLEEAAGRFALHTMAQLGVVRVKAAGRRRTKTKAWVDDERLPPAFRVLMRRWAQGHAAEHVVNVDQTTMLNIRGAVDRALRDQEGVRPLAARVEEMVHGIGGMTVRARALTIARTESHNAAMFGSDELAKSSDVDYQRKWVSGSDARTRVEHAAANGQLRGPTEPFLVWGESIMRPGMGSGRNSINCRCVCRYVPLDIRRRMLP